MQRLGVVGAGLMGAGIAQVAAAAGIPVLLFDADPAAGGRAVAAIAARLHRQAERGRMSPDEVAAALGRVEVAPDLDALAPCDAVVEAVVEDAAVKRELLERVARLVAGDALLATNTSAIPISAIAGAGPHADRVVGMHFFSPVPAMALCEIVRGLATSDETVRRAEALAHRLGKTSIVVNRDSAGFVTSRLITVLIQEAARIADEGLATPADIDLACTLGFGHALGPLATADLAGVDVSYRAGRAIFEATGDPSFRPPQVMARMVAAGRLGRKTGRGFHDYPTTTAAP